MRWTRRMRGFCSQRTALQTIILGGGLLFSGCHDYGIEEGDSPQIIALKKQGAIVSNSMTGGQIIELKDTGIDDDDLIHFEELPNVTLVNLSGTDVTDEGLKHLGAGPKKLTELMLDDTNITDAGIESIRELSNLSVLSLSGTNITDKTLTLLAENHPGLRDLKLMHCPGITNEGLKSIARLRRLENLFLAECAQVTDEGIQHLMEKRGLKMIHLLKTGCSSTAVEKLANSTGAFIVVNAEGKAAGPLAKFTEQ